MYEYYSQPVVCWVAPVFPMVGGEVPRARVIPTVFARTTAAGETRACLPGGTARYERGQRLEVIRGQRVREGLFYLVVTPDGCAGWVPADHLRLLRRSGAPIEGEDQPEVEFLELPEA